jgi:deoxyribose-phosphate aldolase
MKISRYFDSAVLKPEMTRAEARAAIQQAIDANSYSVCVRGCDIEMAVQMCRGTDTIVSCVLDFPYGYGGAAAKRALAAIYCDQGAKELDMVMNYGYARGGDWAVVEAEIRGVCQEAHARDALVKVIFETSQLTLEQVREATEVSIRAGADFVKTSTGFNGPGATTAAVRVMLDAAHGRAKVKPSGGIRDYETARAYVKMGAQRLGIGFASAAAIAKGEGEGEGSDEAY